MLLAHLTQASTILPGTALLVLRPARITVGSIPAAPLECQIVGVDANAVPSNKSGQKAENSICLCGSRTSAVSISNLSKISDSSLTKAILRSR